MLPLLHFSALPLASVPLCARGVFLVRLMTQNSDFQVTRVLNRSALNRRELVQVTYNDFRTAVLERRPLSVLSGQSETETIARGIVRLSAQTYIQPHYIKSHEGVL